MKAHLLIVENSVCAMDVLFRKTSLVPMSQRLFPTFSSIRFNIFGFILSLLIYLNLGFMVYNNIISISLFEFIYMLSSSLSSTIYWRCYPLSSVYFCLLHLQSDIHSCVDLYLGLQHILTVIFLNKNLLQYLHLNLKKFGKILSIYLFIFKLKYNLFNDGILTGKC